MMQPRPVRSGVLTRSRQQILLGIAFAGLLLRADGVSSHETPNILFCIADDWGRHAGCYGTPWVKTPAFDRIAREGVLFQRAYTPNAKCAPSRACLLTGRNSWQLREAANHICYFPPEFLGWPEALHASGWQVGHTQKGWGPGVALNQHGKPREMTGTAFNARRAEPPTPSISPNDYAANFADFLDQVTTDRPWCFWAGGLEPHRSYEFGSGTAKGGKSLSDIDHVPGYWPDSEDVRHDLLDYAFEVEHFDRHVGRMLSLLEDRGLLATTLVIVTSDHGPPFPRSKGNAYEMANHVPLAMMWPNGIQAPGRNIEDFVSFIDLAPTLLELSGIPVEASGLAEVTGRSLVPLLKSTVSGQIQPDRDHVLIGKERTDVGRPHDWGYPTRGIIRGQLVYIRNYEPSRWPGGNPETGYTDCDAGKTKSVILQDHRNDPESLYWQLCFGKRPAEEFYDLAADPDCLRNLATDETRRADLASLREQLSRELRAQGDPRLIGLGDVFDKYPHATKSHVGFYERFMQGEPIKAGWIDPTDIDKPVP